MTKVKSLKNQAFIADTCVVAESYLDRLRGLIGKTKLEAGQGMLFPRCNNIHMWFMSIPIDVVFIRKEPRSDGDARLFVSTAYSQVKPWKFVPLHDFNATDTLELPAGTIARLGISVGDELCLS